MLPSELALIAALIVVSARKLSRAQYFQKVIHSVAERKRKESREKEARLFSSILPSRDLVSLIAHFTPKWSLYDFPG